MTSQLFTQKVVKTKFKDKIERTFKVSTKIELVLRNNLANNW